MYAACPLASAEHFPYNEHKCSGGASGFSNISVQLFSSSSQVKLHTRQRVPLTQNPTSTICSPSTSPLKCLLRFCYCFPLHLFTILQNHKGTESTYKSILATCNRRRRNQTGVRVKCWQAWGLFLSPHLVTSPSKAPLSSTNSFPGCLQGRKRCSARLSNQWPLFLLFWPSTCIPLDLPHYFSYSPPACRGTQDSDLLGTG